MDRIERLRALEKAVELVAKATPGPWAQEHRRGSDSSYRTEVFDENGEAIATLTWHAKPPSYDNGLKTTSTDRAENAEAIVAVVNFIREHGSALIAELGQEVGAVAWQRGTALKSWRGEQWQECTKDEHDSIKSLGYWTDASGFNWPSVARELYTSPAHTSEARDAQVAELIEATRRLTADIEFRIDDPRSQLLDRARRATTAAVGCNCPGSAKVSYLSHAPNCPAREALGKFAAMRQEGGTP